MKIIDKSVYTFSKDNAPFTAAEAGEELLFCSMDCFSGKVTSEDFKPRDLDLSAVNPAAGPVYIEGAEPGDVLAVDILDIKTGTQGVSGTVKGLGPMTENIETRMRIMPVSEGRVHFKDVSWPLDPMVGVMGTAPAEGSIACGHAGNHGGNMDSNLIKKGARVYFPVRVKGALLQMGDVHATMGNGEISGTGVETAGEIRVNTALIKNFELNWPVTETGDRWYVNVTGKEYEEALILACNEMCRLMEPVYGWDETDIFIYLSVQGSVEINQGIKPDSSDMFNLRLGIPKMAEKTPLIG